MVSNQTGEGGTLLPSPGPADGWALTDALGDMISSQSADGTFRFVSAACRDLLGTQPDDLIGRHPAELVHPDDVERIDFGHRSALAKVPVTLVYRLRAASGRYVWVETTNRIVTDDAGRVSEIVSCTRDVSRRVGADALSADDARASYARVGNVLTTRELSLRFQPVLDLAHQRVVAVEALSRFPGDPSHSPAHWFQDAWAVGLGVSLELLAVRMADTHLERIPRDVALCVNVSPSTVATAGFVDSLTDPTRVIVEVTEHAPIVDVELFQSRVSPLRAAGGRLAIDDFGDGYASLSQVLAVRPHWLKIDLRITQRVTSDPLARALVDAVVSFAADIGLDVVAEGIETGGQLEVLRDLGVELGQGYLLGTPAPLRAALLAGAFQR